MAKRKKPKNNKKTKKTANFGRDYKYPLFTSKLKRKIAVVLMFFLALVITFSFLGRAGSGGMFIKEILSFLVGKAIFSVPLILALGGILFIKPQKKRIFAPIFGGLALFIVGICGLFHSLDINGSSGGFLGEILSWPFLRLFGTFVSNLVFSVIILISLLIFWEFVPKKQKTESAKEVSKPGQMKKQEKKGFAPVKIPEFEIKKIEDLKKKKDVSEKSKPDLVIEKDNLPAEIKGKYKCPPLNLLSFSNEKPSSGDTEYASLIIKKTLANFGIMVEMGEINVGPTVTQYTFKPAEGVKLSKITALTNDLSMALAAHPIRIEAPIPGRSLVGVEIPNKVRAHVNLRELLSLPKFQEVSSPLFFPLGKDVSGNATFANLEKMPHLLVAGSTGSGKTIFLQNLIVSLIFRNSPKILRLILVDPKRVEFPIYASLPHLLTPVIFNAQRTVNLLNWLIGEMERRFDVLSQVKSRDIQSFNNLLSKNSKLREEYGVMPYIILIIDELADLMAAKGREVEAGIVRLSQLARAVGIHLVVATQRPSVDVITGLIKANLTSRVAFQVASHVDSRTILDTAGAESLLGSGDMLYISSEFGKPKRIQGCYVVQQEVKKVIDFIKKQNILPEKGEIEESIKEELEKVSEEKTGGEVDFEDSLYEEAKRIVIEYKKASASLLQRRLKIGYARAARLLDILESKGIVGPADGAKPRDILISDEEENDDGFIDPSKVEFDN